MLAEGDTAEDVGSEPLLSLWLLERLLPGDGGELEDAGPRPGGQQTEEVTEIAEGLDAVHLMVPGQWNGSPAPNEHDILTGSNKDGTLIPGKTCADWTSAEPTLFAQVGHSDGLGPNGNDAPQYRSWNSVHENGGCHDTAPKGGAGRVYCFAID